MAITANHFGRTADGREVYAYRLENKKGICAEVLEYGCALRAVWVPDRNGVLQDVVLGYDTLAEYEAGTASFGAFVGRYANRIENSAFTLDGETYRLAPNDGPNHLHGTFGRMVFQGAVQTDEPGEDGEAAQHLVLKAVSPDGDDGFPGNLSVTVTYTLTEKGALVMDYTATTDAPTLANFTNHSYFNLDGQTGGDVRGQTLRIMADSFCEGNEQTCPTGRILPVAETPFDFRTPKPIGQDLASPDPQLRMCCGYDHNFVLATPDAGLSLAAVAHSPKTGITMETYTTQPGMQLYTANFLDGEPGKNGVQYPQYGAFCLETQHYPCTPSHPEFPPVELRPGEEYHQTTVYSFYTE